MAEKKYVTQNIHGAITVGSGVSDHNRLANRDLDDQHPIEAITNLRSELDAKLDADTALPLIEEALRTKAAGLYYDAKKELNRKAYWYLCSEIDPKTKQGTKESVISGPYDLGQGGGGGGGGVTNLTLKLVDWPSTIVAGGKTVVNVSWTSTIGDDREPTGPGTMYVSVNGRQVIVRTNQAQGLVSLDLSDYIIAGTNSIQVKVLDSYGASLTKIATLTAVTLELKSNFNPNQHFVERITYTYIPYGDVEKTVYFIVDGVPYGRQTVKSTGEQQTYIIKNLTHGHHTLEVYFTATIGEDTVTSNTLFYDLIYCEEGNRTPIIASTFNLTTTEQYVSFNIPYIVYIYGRNIFTVQLLVNGELRQTLSVNTDPQYWEIREDEIGVYTYTIKCGSTERSFTVNITKTTIDVRPFDQNLALALYTTGRNNSEPIEQRQSWTYINPDNPDEPINCTLTNFNWSSNGWVKDADNNTVLRLSGDARVEIPYMPFEEDCKSTGKTIELEIATSAVRDYSSTIMSCLDAKAEPFFSSKGVFVDEDTRQFVFDITLNDAITKEKLVEDGEYVFNYSGTNWLFENETVDLAAYGISISPKRIAESGIEGYVQPGDNIVINRTNESRGFYVTPQIAALRSQQSSISTQYKEDDHVHIAFVIEDDSSTRIIWMYINGIASGAVQYPIGDSFRQINPSIITLGSNNAVLDIYNIRIYDIALSSKQIVTNWIANTQDMALKAVRYHHNNIYDDANRVIISKLPADVPYIIWDIEPLPVSKNDRRPGGVRYVDPTNSSRNYTAINAEYRVQGTSSAVYPVKNIRIKYKQMKDPYAEAKFEWFDDLDEPIKKFAITEDGIKDNYFTYKVDYASSEGANNVELTKLYNDASKAIGIKTPPQLLDDKVRVGIDGFPIIAFHQVNDTVTFCTKANFNNDKANEAVYGFDGAWDDDKQKNIWVGDESWETTNNSADEAKYKIPVTKENFANAFEIRFPDEDGYDNMDKIGPMTAWVASTYKEAATGELLAEPISFTYEDTIRDDDGNYHKQTVITETFTHDTAKYRLAKFKAELHEHFNVKSTLFYYIFTHLYLMIDSRAKNAFPTYFATRTNEIDPETGEYTDGGNRWFWLPYDMDTAIGINNEGKLVFDYNLEDTDQQNGADVFNGQDSVIWNNLREMFQGEIGEMYQNLRTTGLISYEHTEKLFEEHQSKWPENIFNEDSKVKYIEPLATEGNNYLEMLQGAKAQQRKWWLYNRFKYFDSKYNTGDAKADVIQFRAYVPKGVVKPDITITPYADIYATVNYINGNNGTISRRASRNQPITIKNPLSQSSAETDQETYIYSASQLKSIGDISVFRPDTVKIGKAVKLQELIIGAAAEVAAQPAVAELTHDVEINLEKTYYTRELTGEPYGYLVDEEGYRYTSVASPLRAELPYYYEVSYLGQDAGTYTNPNLRELEIGSNILLKKLDVRNCINLKQAIDVSKCTNIEEIYFEGTKIAGITLPDGGNIRIIHLPETLKALTIKNQVSLQDLTLADASGLESLWLENIPNIANINVYDILVQMIDNTAVRLIGVNEHYNSVADIERLYNKLANLKGLDATGKVIDTAQITGSIHVPSIIYADYVRLSNAHPEVTINADEIICTVKFCNWDGTQWGPIYDQVVAGTTLNNPPTPTKDPTIEETFTFDHWEYEEDGVKKTWTDETIILTDLIITAKYTPHVRIYTVTFNPMSDVVHVDPLSRPVGYGYTFAEPDVSDIPSGYSLLGWYTAGGIKWEFATDVIQGDLTLYAHWWDRTKPTVEVSCVDHDSYHIVATDEIGLIGVAVTNTEEEPSEWEPLAAVSHYESYRQVTSAGPIYVWVKDAGVEEPNIEHAMIQVYSIDTSSSVGATLSILENDELVEDDFAIAGSHLVLHYDYDSHYTLPIFIVNGERSANDFAFTVADNLTASISVSPKSYPVHFNIGTHYGRPIPDDTVIYKTLITKPVSQYDRGHSTEGGWFLEPDFINEWDFDNDVLDETVLVNDELTLYVKWIEDRRPTKLTIEIPANPDPEYRTLQFNFTQSAAHAVQIDWGDGSEPETSDSIGSSRITLEHLYDYNETATEYVVEILGPLDGNYGLGTGYNYPVLTAYTGQADPGTRDCRYVKAIELSPDVTLSTINAGYTFKGASITELGIGDYLTELPVGYFANCKQLTGNITIPDQITTIGAAVFSDDIGITSVTLNNNLTYIGANAFDGCSSLASINYDIANCRLTTLKGAAFRGCTALRHFRIPETLTTWGPEIGAPNPRGEMFDGCPFMTSAGPYGSEAAVEYPTSWIYIPRYFGWNTLTEVEFTNNIIELQDYAFSTSGLTSIELPVSLVTIGARAFYYSQNLTDIIIPEGVTTINDEAFMNTSIMNLEIPSTVSHIGARILYQDYSFTSIKLWNINVDAASKVLDYQNAWFVETKNDAAVIHVHNFAESDTNVYDVFGPEFNYYWFKDPRAYDDSKYLTIREDLPAERNND